MINLSILTGLLTSILFGVNVILAKKKLRESNANTHIFLKYLSVTIFAFAIAIFDWNFSISIRSVLFILGVATTRAIYGYSYSYLLKELNTSFVTFVIQSHVFLVLLIEVIMGLEINYLRLIVSALILMTGVFLILRVNVSGIKLDKKSVMHLLLAYVSIGIRPFFIKDLLQSGMTNAFTILFLEFALTSIVFIAIFKPSIKGINKTTINNYGVQGLLSLAGNISLNYGITYGVATIATMMLSFELVVVLVLSYLLLKESLTKNQMAGIALGIIAIVSLRAI